jgi:hypothetical protein
MTMRTDVSILIESAPTFGTTLADSKSEAPADRAQQYSEKEPTEPLPPRFFATTEAAIPNSNQKINIAIS